MISSDSNNIVTFRKVSDVVEMKNIDKKKFVVLYLFNEIPKYSFRMPYKKQSYLEIYHVAF